MQPKSSGNKKRKRHHACNNTIENLFQFKQELKFGIHRNRKHFNKKVRNNKDIGSNGNYRKINNSYYDTLM